MGEIADSIINGDFDEISGEYLGRGQGFPRSIHRNDRKPNPVYGVTNYLTQRGFKNDVIKVKIVKDFLTSKNFDFKTIESEELKFDKMCEEVSKDFGAFVKFVNTQK